MMTFEINGVILPFDATDADTLDKYLRATEACAEKSRSMEDPGTDRKKVVQMYRDICQSVKTVFDDIFGAGTGEKVCGKNDSANQCREAYAALMKEYNRQQEEAQKANEEFQKLFGDKETDQEPDKK